MPNKRIKKKREKERRDRESEGRSTAPGARRRPGASGAFEARLIATAIAAEAAPSRERIAATARSYGDDLYEKLQTPEVRAATDRALLATPDEIGRAAVSYARRLRGAGDAPQR